MLVLPPTLDANPLEVSGPAPCQSVSVVIPCYRSEKSIAALIERLARKCRESGLKWQAVLVDDSSPDGTWTALLALREQYPDEIIAARTFRNLGQHAAICAGLALADGDVVITMDDDLQNRPEDIPALVAAIDRGADVAIASYGSKQHARWRNLSGGGIDGILRWLFDLPKGFELTSFRAMRRGVCERINAAPIPYPYVTALVLSNARSAVNVPVQHQERAFGKSNYTLKRSASLALNLLLNYSPLPLYAVMLATMTAFLSSGVVAAWVVYKWHLGNTPMGWASAMGVTLFVGSQVMLVMLVQLVYVARINRAICSPPPERALGELKSSRSPP